MIVSALLSAFCFIYWLILFVYNKGLFFGHIWFALFIIFLIDCIHFKINIRKKDILIRKIIINIKTVIYLCTLLMIIISSLLLIHSNKENKNNIDYVVLFCRDFGYGYKFDNEVKSRLDSAIIYAKENDGTRFVICTGGEKRREDVLKIADYMILNGIERNRLYLELQSHNIRESIIYSQALINRLIKEDENDYKMRSIDIGVDAIYVDNKPKSVAVMTSKYNVYRCMNLIKELDIGNIDILSTSTDKINFLNNLLREGIAVLAYKFMGYI